MDASGAEAGVQEVTDGGDGKIGPSTVYTFTAELWQYHGESSWGFITLPAELSQDIQAKHGPSATSVGSIKVTATVGATRWATSLYLRTRTAAMCSPSRSRSEQQSN
jgi:Domain of unknown function (DUF1905)